MSSKNCPAYDDGVFKVEQVSQDVDIITMKRTNEKTGGITYRQFSWNRKTFKDKNIRSLTYHKGYYEEEESKEK